MKPAPFFADPPESPKRSIDFILASIYSISVYFPHILTTEAFMLRPYAIIMMIVSISILFFFTGCSSEDGIDKSRVVAEINDFSLTQDEFQRKLVAEMEYTNVYKTTPEAKKEFLQTLVKKELLIQEAKKMGLDKKKEFLSALERYWESTLIKQLMEEKNKEILQIASVSENEIREKYEELKSENTSMPPFEQVEKEIAQDILEIKKTALVDKWMKSLHDKADIKIDSEFIND
ncbi:MAG: SurA N-terminal domain-containing protein [Desulfobacteraceae bacterium]|nr:SurA N-terminal domain-containing protein [Desulfobacteraceae bacterium]